VQHRGAEQGARNDGHVAERAEVVSAHFSSFAAAVLTCIALFDLRVPTLRDAGLMLAAGVCAGFAQISMTRAYALEQAARVSALGYVSVVASALLGAAMLHERPPAIAIVGMLLVVCGGLVVTFAKQRYSPPA
jgi:drug/metabolite transporter (DMT)-like permease